MVTEMRNDLICSTSNHIGKENQPMELHLTDSLSEIGQIEVGAISHKRYSDDLKTSSAQGSSSPSRLFGTSPNDFGRKMGLLSEMDDNEEQDTMNMSGATSIASDEDFPVNIANRRYVQKGLFNDDDESENDIDDEEDGLAFLNRFRKAHALEVNESNSEPIIEDPRESKTGIIRKHLLNPRERDHSSVFSGSLSDPPTTQTREGITSSDQEIRSNRRVEAVFEQQLSSSVEYRNEEDDESPSPSKSYRFRRANHLLPLSSSLGSISQSQELSLKPQHEDSYITEAEKQVDEEKKRLLREAKIKLLAAKSRQEDDQQIDPESSAPSDDGISSTSEADREDHVSSSRKEQRSSKGQNPNKKKKSKFEKSFNRTLDIRPEHDESDNDSIMSEEAAPIFPSALSKKDLEEMNRVQARIEREKRIHLAKAAQGPRERKRFDIKDLLAKIGESEAKRRPGLHLTSVAKSGKEAEKDNSPSSDPIEGFSDNEEHFTEQVSPDTSKKDERKSNAKFEPFYMRIKEKFVKHSSSSAAAHDDDELLGDEDVIDKAIRQNEERDRWRKWQEQKEAVLRQIGKSNAISDTNLTGKTTIDLIRDDDDDIVICNGKGSVGKKGVERDLNKQAKGLGNSLIISDGEDEELHISTSQIQRAGRLIGQGSRTSNEETSNATSSPNKSSRAAKRKPNTQKSSLSNLTGNKLQSYILNQIEEQNLKLRQKRSEGQTRPLQTVQAKNDVENDDIVSMIERLQQEAKSFANPSFNESKSDQEDDSDSDFNPDEDVGNEIEDVIARGSGSEGEEEEGEDDESQQEDASDDETKEQEGSESLSVENDKSVEDIAEASDDERVPVKAIKRSRVVLDEEEENEQDGAAAIDERAKSPAVIHEQESILGDGASNGLAEFFASTPENEPERMGEETPDSTLGQFFQDTQTDAPLRHESFNVLPTKAAGPVGFTQLFEQGTPISNSSMMELMPPPLTGAKGLSLIHGSDKDGFAALRKAQACAAELIEEEPFDLPALDDIFSPEYEKQILALESEAIHAEEQDRLARLMHSKPTENSVTYINKEGFFTQTRPESYSFNLSQTQTPILNDESQKMSIDSSINVNEIEPNNQNEEMDTMQMSLSNPLPVEEEEEEEEGFPVQTTRKRFRLARASSNDNEGSEHGLAQSNHDAKEQEPKKTTAFDILKEASKSNAKKVRDKELEQRRRRFVFGEAEESDGESEEDEENQGQSKKKRNYGGLEGVFSDEEGGDSDEEEDEDDDGQDLEGLIDEDRDENEAEKDVLARERYLQDMDEDDRAALALHERATHGAFRRKRRARNHQDGTLEDFLEEDFEEDWLEKVARNPYGNIAKKRRLEGKDGMDLLAEKEDSQAFVREYRDTHQDPHSLDAYDFLVPIDDEEEEDERQVDQVHESGDDNSLPSQEKVSRKEIQQAIVARRRARRQEAMRLHALDDEIEAEERREREREERERELELQRNIEKALFNASDDEDELDIDQNERIYPANRSQNEVDEDVRRIDDLDENESSSRFGLPLIASANPVSEKEKARLARLAKEYENEPDWRSPGDESQKGRKGIASKASNISSIKHCSRNSQANAQKNRTNVHARLRGVLSRESQFSGN